MITPPSLLNLAFGTDGEAFIQTKRQSNPPKVKPDPRYQKSKADIKIINITTIFMGRFETIYKSIY